MAVPAAKHFVFIQGKVGRTVVRTPITKTTDNVTGRETLTSGTSGSITAVAMRVDATWTQADVAKLEGADGYIMVSGGATMTEHDLITFDSETFEVQNLVTIYWADTAMHKYGRLLLKQ